MEVIFKFLYSVRKVAIRGDQDNNGEEERVHRVI